MSNIFSFNEHSKNGLVVVDASGMSDFMMQFAKFDSEKKTIDTGVIDRGALIDHKYQYDNKYYVIELAPGYYVFRDISSFSNNTRSIYCLSKGTYGFNVEAGKAVYLGNITYNGGGNIKAAKGDLSKAQLALYSYPNVKTYLNSATLEPTTFKSGTLPPPLGKCGAFF